MLCCDVVATARPSAWHPFGVRANAFGAGVARRDGLLSPGHPVLVKRGSAKVLAPTMNPMNGTTIERMSMQSATYWHVELDQHDVLLADGLPAERASSTWALAAGSREISTISSPIPPSPPPASTAAAARSRSTGPLVEAERKRRADLLRKERNAATAASIELAFSQPWPVCSPGSSIPRRFLMLVNRPLVILAQALECDERALQSCRERVS
ncbi:hypothetical protein ATO4_16850 [Aurantimonas sp. 22II-16-19i]|nr:hypothetical protein ATO4_16850 [Aurantimonas sp. 22II-16-19i]